jgi:hypothetical protein
VDYGQLDAIILTESTFSFGAIIVELADDVVLLGVVVVEDVVDDIADSSVPAISTLCPTCGVNFASSASRRYEAATASDEEPAVPAVADPPFMVFVRMNLLASALAPAVPVVPVALGSARCRHPETVTVLLAELDAA